MNVVPTLFIREGLIIHPQKLMNPTGFQNTLGEFRIPNTCLAEAVIGVWNMELLNDINNVAHL